MNLIEYLESKNVVISKTGKNISSNWIGMQCPFCDDKSNHLGIHPKTGKVTCWKCGKHSLFKLISFLEKTNNKAKILEIISSIGLEKKEDGVFVPNRKFIEPTTIELTKSPEHCAYLQKRNFDPFLIQNYYKVSAFTLNSTYPWSLYIPVIFGNRVMTFTTRKIYNDNQNRYRDCPKDESVLHTKEVLYQFDKTDHVVIVVEGVTDQWRIGDGSVAAFGMKLSPAQMALLKKKKLIYFLLDKGTEAQARLLASALLPFVEVKLIRINVKDPASLTEKQAQEIRLHVFGRKLHHVS